MKKYEGYVETSIPDVLINRDGSVISASRGAELAAYTVPGKPAIVGMMVGGKHCTAAIGRLLAEAFIEMPAHVRESGWPLLKYRDENPQNIAINNLYWATMSDELFRRRDLARDKRLTIVKESTGGIVPSWDTPVESALRPGYYHIPDTNGAVVVDKVGELFNLETNEVHPAHKNKRGYFMTSLVRDDLIVGKRARQWLVVLHRIVARLFVKRPDRHADIPYENLTVNHMDGNKENNDYNNLEWITNLENLSHAISNSLMLTRPVLSRNVLTGEILRYESGSGCARAIGVPAGQLFAHLGSPLAGRLIHDSCVYMLENDGAWPTVLQYENDDVSVGYDYNFIATSEDNEHQYIGTTLREAATAVGLNYNSVRTHRAKVGADIPYKGWTFLRLEEYLGHLDNHP